MCLASSLLGADWTGSLKFSHVAFISIYISTKCLTDDWVSCMNRSSLIVTNGHSCSKKATEELTWKFVIYFSWKKTILLKKMDNLKLCSTQEIYLCSGTRLLPLLCPTASLFHYNRNIWHFSTATHFPMAIVGLGTCALKEHILLLLTFENWGKNDINFSLKWMESQSLPHSCVCHDHGFLF